MTSLLASRSATVTRCVFFHPSLRRVVLLSGGSSGDDDLSESVPAPLVIFQKVRQFLTRPECN